MASKKRGLQDITVGPAILDQSADERSEAASAVVASDQFKTALSRPFGEQSKMLSYQASEAKPMLNGFDYSHSKRLRLEPQPDVPTPQLGSKKIEPRRSSCVFLPSNEYKGSERLSKRNQSEKTPENSAP